MRHDRGTSLLLMTHSKSEFRQEVINEVYDDFEKIIGSLEQRIKELEAPKSCDGCRFDSERQFGCYRFDDCSREHTRKERIDRYEPKDK